MIENDDQPTSGSFADQLRRLASEAGLSQTELARRTGLDRTEVNRLMTGKREPRLVERVFLAGALGEPGEALLVRADEGELPDEIRAVAGIVDRCILAEGAQAAAVAELDAAKSALAAKETEYQAEIARERETAAEVLLVERRAREEERLATAAVLAEVRADRTRLQGEVHGLKAERDALRRRAPEHVLGGAALGGIAALLLASRNRS